MPHTCYACDPANPDRLVFEAGRITVPARFQGYAGYLNGGVAVGLLGCPALRRAVDDGGGAVAVARIQARLHRPLPLEGMQASERCTGDRYEVMLRDGDAVYATGVVEVARFEGEPAPGELLSPDLPEEQRAEAEAMAAIPAGPLQGPRVCDALPPGHATFSCFSCGPANPRGLHVFPRVVDQRHVCATWDPEAGFADPGGGLSSLIQAAAMDCSSAWCIAAGDPEQFERRDETFALGTFDIRFLRVPPLQAKDGYRVVGRWLGREGRKFYGACALLDARRTLYAFAESIWVIVPAP